MQPKNFETATPVAFLHKKVKFDLKPVFKGVTKLITHAATLKLEELGNDTVETLTGLGLESTPNELAFILIKRALSAAFLELAEDSFTHFEDKGNAATRRLSQQLEKDLSTLKIELGRSFLDAPGEQKFLADILPLYSQWLVDMGVAPHSAELISSRLPSYFIFALTNEWRKNHSQYKTLIDALQTPFAKAAERELDWQNYFAMLSRRTQENIFDEPFSLAQIYVPLNAYYLEERTGKKASSDKFEKRDKRVAVDLATEITNWLKKGKVDDAIRVVSGGPGSGKSSFTKILCSEVAAQNIAKPIYIPLHLIDPTREVSEEVAKFVRDEGLLRFNPLDPEIKESKLLLVFDGLDELANQGKVAAQVARDFVHAVEKMVERRNIGPLPIKVLLSGREVVVQENQSEFRRPRQILTILPYFVPEHERQEYEDPGNLLKRDSRNEWWKKYGALSSNNFEGLPRNLQRHEIDEITAQPLLNYLVALSFTRGKIDFVKSLNLNTIYADLVTAVYERGYEKGRTFRPIKHISCKDFIRVLEEIGLAAWHASDGRSTSVNEILAHCRESGLERLVQSFQEGAQAGVTKLLAAFFFRKSGEHASGDPTFVFTHKSFGEYLTATRVVRSIERIVTQVRRRNEDPDDGFDVVEALVHWVKIAGPAQTTHQILRFLINEIRQRPVADIQAWQDILTQLLSHVVDRGMPMEKLGALTFADASRQNANASEALVLALNACASVNERIVKLNLLSDISFGSFLRRIVSQRQGPTPPILYMGLSYFDFSDQLLDIADFYGANLSHTVWRESGLHHTNFCTANLESADFSGAQLGWANFTSANLEGVNFKDATLTEAIFRRASLKGVDFGKSELTGADLISADIDNSNFVGAHVHGARILMSAYQGNNFIDAEGADFLKIEEDVEEDDDEEDDEQTQDEEPIENDEIIDDQKHTDE